MTCCHHPLLTCHNFCLPPCRTHRHFHSLCRLPSQRRIFLGRNLSRPFRCPLIRNAQLQISIHFHSSPPSPTNQEYSWISRPAPLRFICNLSCSKIPVLKQLFESTNMTPNVVAIQAYLSLNALLSSHDTFFRPSIPLSTILDNFNLTLA